MDYGHSSVLLHESLDALDLQKGEIFVDGTLGSAGHTEEVLKRLGKDVRIIGLDQDEDALERARKRLKSYKSSITLVQDNFRHLDIVLDELKIEKVDKILLDIGLSSNQFEESGRGFSFQKDEPLGMTFKKKPGEEDLTAAMILNEWGEDTLETILRGYGEETFARKIARAIVEYRELQPFRTTHQLVEVVKEATPGWYHHRKLHFATKTFQALRIAVNDELEALKEGIQKGFERLESGGRIAVISFHSLEDRIVKNFFRDKHKEEEGILITKRPITPGDKEITENRRARSAKLRVLQKK
ncbi:16S rRNA (cytosine(1402)-N(4))-methyltransferase RsmH [Candidatus Parcubacteria bacterium]|nr:16S rRNA (cytosine(1402)-N(4))-methyltransferase RsmH [Candidatus Parcubacteria bacterium]